MPHKTWSSETYQGATIFIIFAQYAYEGLSAKDRERQRRAGEGAAIYQLTLTSRLPPRDAIKPSQQVPTESTSLQFKSWTQHQHGWKRKLSCTSQWGWNNLGKLHDEIFWKRWGTCADGEVGQINAWYYHAVSALRVKCQGLSQCDTVSFPCGKGKDSVQMLFWKTVAP